MDAYLTPVKILPSLTFYGGWQTSFCCIIRHQLGWSVEHWSWREIK